MSDNNELITKLAEDTIQAMINNTAYAAHTSMNIAIELARAQGIVAETVINEVNALVERTLNLGS